ncbi:MAG: nucleotidyltransferase domain-containing protein [Armatimonadetes bacterium]|nr:nucleotidyltransferase domain-containing protein [Armatimonadota bacterium]
MGEEATGVGGDAVAPALDPEVGRFLRECLDPIRAAFAPQALFLFGSRVHAARDEWSDIDILLVSDRFAGQRMLDRLRAFRRQIDPHRHVDVLCVTPEGFEQRRNGATIIAEAVRTGVRII